MLGSEWVGREVVRWLGECKLAAMELASPAPSPMTSLGTTYRFVGFLVVYPSIS